MIIEINEFRNAKYFNETIIDCEINHPELGWLPFSCHPEDTGSTVDVVKLYEKLKASNPEPYVPPTEEEILTEKASIAPASFKELIIFSLLLLPIATMQPPPPEPTI